MANRVILIVPDGADSLLNLLDQYMQEWVSANMAQTTPLEANTPPSEAQQDAHRSDPANVPAVARAAENESGSSTPSGVSNMLAPSLQAVNDLLRKLSTIGAQDAAEHAQPTSFAAMEHKHRALNTQDLPFEMHAIEALLTTVMALETQEFNRVNAQVQVILGYFRSGSLLPIEVQEKMRNRKNELLVMQRRISSARNAVHELTEDDEDMALMSLSVLRAKPSLYRYCCTG